MKHYSGENDINLSSSGYVLELQLENGFNFEMGPSQIQIIGHKR